MTPWTESEMVDWVERIITDHSDSDDMHISVTPDRMSDGDAIVAEHELRRRTGRYWRVLTTGGFHVLVAGGFSFR